MRVAPDDTRPRLVQCTLRIYRGNSNGASLVCTNFDEPILRGVSRPVARFCRVRKNSSTIEQTLPPPPSLITLEHAR